MGFLESQKGKTNNKREDNPFAKKGKAPETKVVKINAELHQKLNVYKAKRGSDISLTDLINEAVTEYIERHPEINRANE